jgi:hypothetical protein
MKKLPGIVTAVLLLTACGNDSAPKDDNIDQDSLHVMENRQDQDNRNTTSYDSIPDKVIKDSTAADTSKNRNPN